MPKQCLDNAHAISSSIQQLDQHRHETPAQAKHRIRGAVANSPVQSFGHHPLPNAPHG